MLRRNSMLKRVVPSTRRSSPGSSTTPAGPASPGYHWMKIRPWISTSTTFVAGSYVSV
jgi:hypothetical protein